MEISVEFTHFWHCGSGQSGGKKSDALVVKDNFNIPYIPGKTMKGILREAVRQVEGFKQFKDIYDNDDFSLTDVLFGSRDNKREKQFGGLLAVSDARLDKVELDYLVENPNKTQLLTRNVNRTAINESGTAVEGSLRTQEVAIPMTLTSEIELLSLPTNNKQLIVLRKEVSANINSIISGVLPFVDGIGGLRQRGLGRCILRMEN